MKLCTLCTQIDRFSKDGKPCTKIRGIMDDNWPNVGFKNRWSPCSFDDVEAYYNNVGPKQYAKCMKILEN